MIWLLNYELLFALISYFASQTKQMMFAFLLLAMTAFCIDSQMIELEIVQQIPFDWLCVQGFLFASDESTWIVSEGFWGASRLLRIEQEQSTTNTNGLNVTQIKDVDPNVRVRLR